MKRCLLIVLGLMAGLAGPVAAQTPVGVNAEVENSVRTRSLGEGDWRASVVDGIVRQADAIVTGDQARLLIRLRDQSELTVGANASLNVDRFLIDAEPDPAGVLFSLVRGAFRFVSGSRGAERDRVAFRTPTATVGIRGTIIEAAVGADAVELLRGETVDVEPGDDPEQAAVIVLVEGEIEIEVDGVRRIVREPGQAVAVTGRRVSQPFRLSPEAGRRLADRLPPRELGGPGAVTQGQGPNPQGQAPQAQPPQGQPPQGQTPQGQGNQAGPSGRAPGGPSGRPPGGGGGRQPG